MCRLTKTKVQSRITPCSTILCPRIGIRPYRTRIFQSQERSEESSSSFSTTEIDALSNSYKEVKLYNELPTTVNGGAAACTYQEVLDAVGLSGRATHLPGELSGGQQQRVAIARAIINNPPIILADEPTGALDSKTGEEILDLFKRLKNEGHTMVLITHDAKVAEHADRICVMRDGKLFEGEKAA